MTCPLGRRQLRIFPSKKGFTNMAQAFALAEVMYTGAGRKGAQSAIMVITDGKPSFQFQTNELVRQLDDKNVQRYFLVVNENGGDDLKKKCRSGQAHHGKPTLSMCQVSMLFQQMRQSGPRRLWSCFARCLSLQQPWWRKRRCRVSCL